jgi:hypothetical protein
LGGLPLLPVHLIIRSSNLRELRGLNPEGSFACGRVEWNFTFSQKFAQDANFL